MNIYKLAQEVASVLSPNLLLKEFRVANYHPTAGHCYAASEALYHLAGGAKSGWHPVRAKDFHGITHWWLKHRETNEIVDPTATQYTDNGFKPIYIYAQGRAGGFLTKKPSWRAKEIMRRVRAKK